MEDSGHLELQDACYTNHSNLTFNGLLDPENIKQIFTFVGVNT